MLLKIIEQGKMIRKKPMAAQDQRNSYAELNRRPYEFWCGIICTIDGFTDGTNYKT